MIDRTMFFPAVRSSLFGGDLDQKQVDGMNAILASWEETHDPIMPRLAYVLATAYHEARLPPLWRPEMQPVEEYGKGHGLPYGNPDPVTGQIYYGRGLVQLTWKTNYERMGEIVGAALLSHPERALEPELSTRILIEGMVRGTFTGKALKDYFPPGGTPDFVGARRIINGTDKAAEIAEHAEKFNAALQASV